MFANGEVMLDRSPSSSSILPAQGELSRLISQGGMGDPLYPPEDFDAAAARLRAVVVEACARPEPWPARVCAAIDAALAFLDEDSTAARLLLLDPGLRHEDAFAPRAHLLAHFATLLSSGRTEAFGDSEQPALTEEYVVGALASLLADRLRDERRGVRLQARSVFASQLAEFALLHYLGSGPARLWSSRALLSSEDSPDLDSVEFTEILLRLQGMIGAEARVVINLLGHFFDCGFNARLERVETLSGDDGPVLIVFAGAQGIALDPDEVESFVGSWPGTSSAWIELQIADRLRLVIEPLTEPEADQP
jgi:hypothetical protein